jgi:xylulokinase
MYIGIDIGTSSVKSALIDSDQTLIGAASHPLTVSRPQSGWSEQNPRDWWSATLETIDALAADHPAQMAKLRGIGLSGQMHGATLLDGSDQVLRPAILWNDGRSAAECAELEDACPNLRAITGNIAMPGFTAPKLAWVAKHEPEIFAATRKVLLPKDYIRLQLTGEYAGDMSDCAGTLWLDVGARDWSDELLAATGLDRSHMPHLVEGTEVSGTLRNALATRWGIDRPPIVAGGGGDNAASACGIGAVRPGDAFVSLGTSGVLFVSNGQFSPNTDGAVHAFCHAVPGTWHQMGVILSATDSLQWLAGILNCTARELTAALGDTLQRPGSVLFAPYLSGERTPHNDAVLRGGFLGIGHDSDAASLTRAIMEGVAFAFRDCLEVLAAAGTTVDRAAAIGGGAQARLWVEMLATVLNRPLDIPKDGDYGAAFGAARLGLIAAENADPAEICTAPPIAATIDPRRDLTTAYDDAYGRYRALYPAIKEVFKA